MSAGTLLSLMPSPIGPGGKIGTMRLARGVAATANLKLFDSCDPVITQPATYLRTCARVPSRVMLIGPRVGKHVIRYAASRAPMRPTRRWHSGSVDLARSSAFEAEGRAGVGPSSFVCSALPQTSRTSPDGGSSPYGRFSRRAGERALKVGGHGFGGDSSLPGNRAVSRAEPG